jgi:hypothetical protein
VPSLVSPLVAACYKPPTVKRYMTAFLRFLLFIQLQGAASFLCFEDLDAGLAEYAHVVFAEGLPKAWAKDAIFGACMYLPAARFHLSVAKRALQGFGKLEPATSFPPVLPGMVPALFTFLFVLCGLDRMAVCVFVCYAALLRASEALALRREDWAPPGDVRLGAGVRFGVLRLRSCKTGREQMAKVFDPSTCRLLSALAGATLPGGLLFPFGHAQFLKVFKIACTACGFPGRLVLHSLRHGGAVGAYLAGVSIDNIMLMGRRASLKSVKVYLQLGTALSTAQVLSPQALAVIGAADLNLPRLVSSFCASREHE